MKVTHYHVVERVGESERVVATFASAFQAGRDMALRERSARVIERPRLDEPTMAFPTADDVRRDASRREPPPRAVVSYMACSCTDRQVLGQGPLV